MENGIVVLETQVIILKMGKICVKAAQFEAEILIVAFWQNSKVEHEKVAVHATDFWIPILGIQNVVGNLETLSRKVGVDSTRKFYFVQEVTLWGRFHFEVDNFYYPYDVQNLTLVLFCQNSGSRKVLITNNLNMLHCVRHDFHCLSTDFVIYDVIDSATTRDQEYHGKNFSVLKITFYASRLIGVRTSRWLIFPCLFAIMTMMTLFVENMLLLDKMLSLSMVLIILSLVRRLMKWSITAFCLMEVYWWCLNLLSTLSLFWCGFQMCDLFPESRRILALLYPVVVISFSGWIYLQPWKIRALLNSNSLVYKAAMLGLQGEGTGENVSTDMNRETGSIFLLNSPQSYKRKISSGWLNASD